MFYVVVVARVDDNKSLSAGFGQAGQRQRVARVPTRNFRISADVISARRFSVRIGHILQHTGTTGIAAFRQLHFLRLMTVAKAMLNNDLRYRARYLPRIAREYTAGGCVSRKARLPQNGARRRP